MKFKSKIGKLIELTNERKKHIIEYHPDVKIYISKISDVLEEPGQIRKSRHDPEVLLFYKYFVVSEFQSLIEIPRKARSTQHINLYVLG